MSAPPARPAVILALDCDGTLEASGGPVTAAKVRELEAQGIKPIIVSPSPACAGFAQEIERMDGADRTAALQAIATRFPGVLKVYSGDTVRDEAIAVKAKWGFIWAKALATI